MRVNEPRVKSPATKLEKQDGMRNIPASALIANTTEGTASWLRAFCEI